MDTHDKLEKICDLPYGTEYAKSNRSSCKKCKGAIGLGSLRISAREPSRHFDGIQDNWFHTTCFFDRLGYGTDKINETSIRGFDNLKWDDQELLRRKIADVINGSPIVSDFESYRSEYSKTNKGKCYGCKENFKAQELKIGKKSSWYHHQCSLVSPTPMQGDVEDIRGFEELKPEDQEMLRDTYAPVKKEVGTNTPDPAEAADIDNPAGSAMKEEVPSCSNTVSEDGADVKVEVKEEPEAVPKKRFRFAKDPAPKEEDHKEKMKKQTDIMWELREQFQFLKKPDMIELLKANNQTPPDNEGQMLELLVDCATFGRPSRCPKCLSGQIIFSLSTRTYTCLGYITEYTKCPYSDPNPVRSTFIIPRDMFDRLDILRQIKVNRLLERTYAEAQTVVDRSTSNAFTYLGARHMKPVESYCEGRKGGNKGVHTKIVKKGTVVDGEFQHAEKCHVYRDEKNGLYSTTLSMSDLVSNANSYYRMQLLKDDHVEHYYVFRSWGRVGTDIGSTKVDDFRKIDSAKAEFERLFHEKTGNIWEHRDYFEKKGGKFGLVDTDYSELETAYDDEQKTVKAGSMTKMHRAVKEVMMMISDVNNIKKALNELELDVKKMPLGKLSKQQIKSAYAVLTELTNLLDSDDPAYERVLDCTNRFYTLLPHDFGMKAAPLLDNHAIIKEKCKMLDSLLDFEITVQLLNQGRGLLATRDPVDVNYENLKCKMEYLDPKSEEFRLITDYLANTHGATHGFKLEIKDVLKLEREGESQKFTKDLGNRRLLWHGSGVGNYMGILSQGLRIAPPEAPATGYMFGKGVYFADMVSKSANYCRANFGLARKGTNEGLLLLCDVALGSVDELYMATNVTKVKKGCHSVKGVGQWRPQDNKYEYDSEGCLTIYGAAEQVPNDPQNPFHLIYNEYIVYNTDQIRLRYLVRVSG